MDFGSRYRVLWGLIQGAVGVVGLLFCKVVVAVLLLAGFLIR